MTNTYHLHVGMLASDVTEGTTPTEHGEMIVDGDGWECWGEDPLTDVNQPHVRHVVFTFTSPGDITEIPTAVTALMLARPPGHELLLQRLIVPMRNIDGPHRQNGTLVVVTTEHDHSEALLVLSEKNVPLPTA